MVALEVISYLLTNDRVDFYDHTLLNIKVAMIVVYREKIPSFQ